MTLKNEKGQMAIFIALFFQVLFVFFAMAINVGLVVHDKINLQNAVDLAAYYGAARQSEILNQMGHINYQMRQNYKLFVWRYRVLSTLGLSNHPYNNESQTNSVLGEYDITDPAATSRVVPPVACVSHYYWDEYNRLDEGSNLCRQTTQVLPNIRPAGGGAGFVAGYNNLVTFTQMANTSLARTCMESGILNWMFASRMLAHFRIDGAVRKRKIKKLAESLRTSKDLRNESIEDGVRKTFDNNLTNSNLSGVQDFQYFNSMAQGACSSQATWLPEIQIRPIMMFKDFEITGSNNDCRSEVNSGSSQVKGILNTAMDGRNPNAQTGLNNLPFGFNDATLWGQYYSPSLNQLIQHWGGEPPRSSEFHSSVGFEKNPWCMVYTGVKATTLVRKPFSPLGGGVRLEAHGFAKPFGGRIGPWYGKSWPQGAPNSQATDRVQMVDALLPSRDVAGGGGASLDPADDIANYSRFPGDTLGLKSARAMSGMLQNFKGRLGTDQTNPTPRLGWSTYNHLGGQPTLQQTGDSLARDSNTMVANQREFELAALAPDWFDAFYYSVEPNYFTNYFLDVTTNNGALFGQEEKIYDFGSSKEDQERQKVNVIRQVATARNLYESEAQYVVRRWQNLLTSWHQNTAVDYSVNSSRFGECQAPVSNDSLPTTGNCIQGGRTGYSIKNLSRDYLLSGDHKLGGQGGATGPVLNPPTF